MLGRFGEVCVLDWGLAAGFGREAPRWLPAAAEIHAVSGTPDYMAPEIAMADGARISPRTDVYLLGAMLHEVVTGVAPHPGATLLERLEHAYRSAPTPTPRRCPRSSRPSSTRACTATRSGASRPRRRSATRSSRSLDTGGATRCCARQPGGSGCSRPPSKPAPTRYAYRISSAQRASRSGKPTEVRKTAESAALRGRLFGGMARHAMDAGRLALAESYLREIEGHADLRQRLADCFVAPRPRRPASTSSSTSRTTRTCASAASSGAA